MTAVMSGDGPESLKAVCSNEWVLVRDICVNLMSLLKIIAVPPPRPSEREVSM